MSGQRQSSRLLINEAPLQVLPSLAAAIGLNEAIVLQQIHFLLSTKEAAIADGTRWITRSMEAWAQEFSWWNVKTVKRIFTNLRKLNLIITGKFNQNKWDHTLWYRVDYDALEALTPVPVDRDKMSSSEGDNLTQSEGDKSVQSSILDKKDKKDSSEPSVQSAAQKPRERNLVFDAIALGSFNMATVPKGKGGRTGKLETAIKECEFPDGKPTPERLASLASDLTAMYAWYKIKYPTLSMPCQAETIWKYLGEYRATLRPVKPLENYTLVESVIYQSETEAA